MTRSYTLLRVEEQFGGYVMVLLTLCVMNEVFSLVKNIPTTADSTSRFTNASRLLQISWQAFDLMRNVLFFRDFPRMMHPRVDIALLLPSMLRRRFKTPRP